MTRIKKKWIGAALVGVAGGSLAFGSGSGMQAAERNVDVSGDKVNMAIWATEKGGSGNGGGPNIGPIRRK